MVEEHLSSVCENFTLLKPLALDSVDCLNMQDVEDVENGTLPELLKSLCGGDYENWSCLQTDETGCLTDEAFSACITAAGDIFATIRALLTEGLREDSKKTFETIRRTAKKNPFHGNFFEVRNTSIYASQLLANKNAETDRTFRFPYCGSYVFPRLAAGLTAYLRWPALAEGVLERKYEYRGMLLGLGLCYFREAQARSSGDNCFLERHHDEWSAFHDKCDNWSCQYTGRLFSEIERDPFNFSCRNIKVVDGKLEKPGMKAYARDVLIPELISLPDNDDVPSEETLIKLQLGCALAVAIGEDERWFALLMNSELCSFYRAMVDILENYNTTCVGTWLLKGEQQTDTDELLREYYSFLNKQRAQRLI